MQTISNTCGQIKTPNENCPTGINTISIANAACTHTYDRFHAGESLADFIWEYLGAGFVARRDGDHLILTYADIGTDVRVGRFVEWSRA